MTIFFSPEAEKDFAAAIAFLEERNSEAAARLGARIFEVIDKLASGAFDGPEQTLASGELVRSWPVPPLLIFYRRQATAFWVLRIYHQARLPIR